MSLNVEMNIRAIMFASSPASSCQRRDEYIYIYIYICVYMYICIYICIFAVMLATSLALNAEMNICSHVCKLSCLFPSTQRWTSAIMFASSLDVYLNFDITTSNKRGSDPEIAQTYYVISLESLGGDFFGSPFLFGSRWCSSYAQGAVRYINRTCTMRGQCAIRDPPPFPMTATFVEQLTKSWSCYDLTNVTYPYPYDIYIYIYIYIIVSINKYIYRCVYIYIYNVQRIGLHSDAPRVDVAHAHVALVALAGPIYLLCMYAYIYIYMYMYVYIYIYIDR